MTVTVNALEAKNHIMDAFQARLVPLLHGSPAVGKSAIFHQIAEEQGLKVIDIRLAQCDPTDLSGFPSFDSETGRARYAPIDMFPLEGDKIPEGYNGWLLFFDELTSANRAVQAAAYKVLLDGMIGNHKLHPNVVKAAAGNLETDNAIVEEMSTALQSRLVHLELEVDNDIWLDWAMRNDIDHRITSYIKFKPNMLYNFSPDHTDKTYASPRTWEFTNRLVNGKDKLKSMLPLLAGTVSEGVAREFIGFTDIYTKLATIEQIKQNPDGINVPEEPSILFALTGSIGNNATKDNLEDLMRFVVRIPIEFQVVCLREMVRRDPLIQNEPSVTAWINKNATELF